MAFDLHLQCWNDEYRCKELGVTRSGRYRVYRIRNVPVHFTRNDVRLKMLGCIPPNVEDPYHCLDFNYRHQLLLAPVRMPLSLPTGMPVPQSQEETRSRR